MTLNVDNKIIWAYSARKKKKQMTYSVEYSTLYPEIPDTNSDSPSKLHVDLLNQTALY